MQWLVGTTGTARAKQQAAPLDWLLGRLSPVRGLQLGDGIEIETVILVFRFAARTVSRIRFAPDPAEDYAEAERKVQLCQVIVEMDLKRQFRMIVDEVDAQRLRQWAVAKGINVNDCDGYRPPPTELAAGA